MGPEVKLPFLADLLVPEALFSYSYGTNHKYYDEHKTNSWAQKIKYG